MTHDDPLSAAMFWVGALFVFTPLVLAGIVIGMWWYTRRRARRARDHAATAPADWASSEHVDERR